MLFVQLVTYHSCFVHYLVSCTTTIGIQSGLSLYLKYSDILNAELVKQLEQVVVMLMSYAESLPQHVRKYEIISIDVF